jgi:hypothetical protein
MARRLSNIEWATFLQEVNVPALGLPPWGGVIEWRGMDILVYIGPTGEVFTTDVSDMPAITSNTTRVYDARQEVWAYHLPEQLLQTTIADAAAVAKVTTSTVEELGRVIGETAGGLTAPLLENLTLPLVVVGVIGLIYLAKK